MVEEVLTETFTEAELKKYNITDTSIAKLSREGLSLFVKGVEDKEGYQLARRARMKIKTTRARIEKTRKGLKAKSLFFGKAVDGEAKRITALLLPIEEHLISQEKIVDDEKERVKNSRNRKRIERLVTEGATLVDMFGEPKHEGSMYAFDALSISLEDLANLPEEGFEGFVGKLAEAVQSRKDKDAELRAEQEREEAERKAESGRLEKIRVEQEKKEAEIREQQEKIRIEQEKVEAEKKKIEEQKNKEAENKKRQIENERIIKEAKEKVRIAAEEKFIREAKEKRLAVEQEKKEERLRIAMLPDKEKLIVLATDIEALEMPALAHNQSHEILSNAKHHLVKACQILRKEKK